jgi:hypothetical protein
LYPFSSFDFKENIIASFSVSGPFTLKPTKMPVGRQITKQTVKDFWLAHPASIDSVGCYVFAFKASKGFKPVYAGKATKSFGTEVFSTDKLNKYNTGLAHQKKGTPVLFFISLNKTAGVINKKAIEEAESYLIQACLAANPKLINVQKTKVAAWSINGIVRSHTGKPSAAAQKLRTCIKI